MTRRITPLTFGIAFASVLMLSGCVGDQGSPETPTAAPSGAAAFLSNISTEIPEAAVAAPVTTRLADGLPTPTGKWFSGLVFNDTPQPVFPSPLSFQWQDEGFGVGVPAISATETTVFGSAVVDVAVDLGAGAMTVSAFDDASVTMTAATEGGSVDVRIAQGWPAVEISAVDADLALPLPLTEIAGGWSLDGAARWGINGVEAQYDGGTLTVPAGSSVRLFAAPEGTDVADAAQWFGAGLSDVVASSTTTSDTVTTTLTYADEPTLIVPPATVASGCDLAGYGTLYGDAPACFDTSVSWETPRVEATSQLNLSGLTPEDEELLTASITADTETLADPSSWPGDSYFGGKGLYRAAALLEIAEQIGDEENAATLRELLTEQIRLWTDPAGCETRTERCLQKDMTYGGYIAQAPSFGSDEYNDHHFHYGYLIYAAAVLAESNPDLRDEIAPVINAYVADIASPTAVDRIPRNRQFDPYWGHSWASGYSPFGDGNNQESVSESLMAWAGTKLWADVIGDETLAANAEWMLSAETASARSQWWAPDLADSAYQAPIVSLVWGGKLDYATWFSDVPTAKLGILLIPMAPSTVALEFDPDTVLPATEAALATAPDGALHEYVRLYAALVDTAAAQDAVDYFTDATTVDDGLTRSYALAVALAALRSGG